MPIADQTWAQIVAQTLGHDDPAIMSDSSANRGRPTVRGTEIPVAAVLVAMRDGTYDELKEIYPEFTKDMPYNVFEGVIRIFSA